ncbi:MAG: UDP-3-O-(3-hydroxymyristoyl)glucosamine N-acyltransferase [Mesonia hippocampi]|uniref:UDP-3-O-(3-hydroxymyristoyl)glucosamine N-acyltransferase n=1 Tax=Mesonia hippocampi TaxID=1628250 RepID=UPI003F97C93B
MKFTAQQIAEILDGSVEGNPEAEVFTLSKIEEGKEGSLTFLANPKYTSYIYATQASICIVNNNFTPEQAISTTLIKVADAYAAFSKLLDYYNQIKLHKEGIEQPSFIDETATYGENIYLGAFAYIGKNAKIGDNVKIYPNAYIGDNVVIGDNTVIFAGVKIYSETQIGNHCIIHAGAVLGADGFGFSPDEEGRYSKVPQIGNVVLHDYVEVGANAAIDRATLGSTVINEGAKLDNLIQIAHNVEVGEHTVLAAQAGVAGSTKIGKHCMIGGQAGVAGHLKIGDKVRAQAQTGIGRNIEDDVAIQGSPAIGYNEFNRAYVYFKKFPELVERLERLEKKLDNHG